MKLGISERPIVMGPTELDLELAKEIVKLMTDKQTDAVDALRALNLASILVLEQVAEQAKEEMS